MKLERLDNLFHAAREMPAAEWEAFLERECGGDAELARTAAEDLHFAHVGRLRDGVMQLGGDAAEIGRASCRERV